MANKLLEKCWNSRAPTPNCRGLLKTAGGLSNLPEKFQKSSKKFRKSSVFAPPNRQEISYSGTSPLAALSFIFLLTVCSLFAHCFLQRFLQRFLEFSPAFPDLLCCSRPFGVKSSLDSTASSSLLAHGHHTKHTSTRGKQWAPAATATATVSIPHANRTNSTVPGGISGKDTRSSTN